MARFSASMRRGPKATVPSESVAAREYDLDSASDVLELPRALVMCVTDFAVRCIINVTRSTYGYS